MSVFIGQVKVVHLTIDGRLTITHHMSDWPTVLRFVAQDLTLSYFHYSIPTVVFGLFCAFHSLPRSFRGDGATSLTMRLLVAGREP